MKSKFLTISFPAFTLIELLVVISIIGILAALLLANFAGIRDRADDAKLKNNLKQVQTALRTYYNDNQVYPATAPAPTNTVLDGYINQSDIPTLMYYALDTTDKFTACIQLSNTADKEAAESETRCGLSPTVAGRFCVCSN